jgi:hypothetical protein
MMEDEMRLLYMGILAIVPQLTLAAENLCRAADLKVEYPRTLLVGRMDSVRPSNPEYNQDFTYDSNGKLLRIAYGNDHDTADFHWSGTTMRVQSRSEKEYEIIYFNSNWYPDSIVDFDSLGQVTWREMFQYGANYFVSYDPDNDNWDSVHFSETGLQEFVEGGLMVNVCETVAHYCSCRSEGLTNPNDSVNTDFYSTGGFLDSVHYSSGNWVRFYWNRTQARLKTENPKPHRQPGGMARSIFQRDIMGRARLEPIWKRALRRD